MPTPTGTVTYQIDSNPVSSPITLDGSGNASTVADGTGLAPGNHHVVVNYSGDTNFTPAVGATNFTIGAGGAVVTVQASVNGTAITLTINVAAQS